MDIDLRLLRVFVAVAEGGGYTAAQSTLNISSSTISLHMSDLEKRIGFRLCERGRHGFSLTERGKVAYDEIRRILGSLDDFTGRMAELRKRLAGKLHLGMVDCLSTHPNFPLVTVIRRFNELDNDVHIELAVAPRADIERAVLGGHLHAGIVPFIRTINGLDFRPVLRERHQLFCGVGHPLFGLGESSVPAHEITEHDFVLRAYTEQFDLSRFPRARASATVFSMEAMLILLLSGGYLGLLPDHVAREWVDRGKLSRVPSDDFEYDSRHMLITSTSAKSPAAINVFLSILDETIAGTGSAQTMTG
ncbi:DNA-binding transcriptional LysR family regulator [Labrys wisconsinensis]|uniref:DNA-binding transcriptional LysR family regulator n=2 Tax=Labrys wisconsinensis TaxID=425677 RepID=A0ABU0J8N6_9HYPH|nr:DNA-binding transcriptional LysR family regulator [Labrys wisconsinensis]